MPLADPPLPRDQFPVAERWVYLKHALVAPLPRAAFAAARAADEVWMLDGSEGYEPIEARAEEVRGTAAALMGAAPAEVAFVKNTTEGLAFAALGPDWAPGDRVVVPDVDFPSTIFPFLALEALGVEVVRVPHGEGGLEAIAAALADGGVRMVVVSWVHYVTGWRVDLAAMSALAHEHGALLCADVIQGLGLLPCDLAAWGVDVAAADGHKWMLGPQGAGVLFVAQRHLDAGTFRVLEPGWNSVVTRDDAGLLDLRLDPTARRYEGGTHNLTGLLALGASLDLLRETGIDRIWRHVDEWCTTARAEIEALGGEFVTSADTDHRSGILTFTAPGVDGDDLHAALTSRGVSCSARGDGVRISPHAWNDGADLEGFLRALRASL